MPLRKTCVRVIAGATATGKTAVGEWLAERLGATVVCADSRQVFRELNAGTGKPSVAQLMAQPHRLFDALSVGEQPSAGWYALAASETLRTIEASGGVALLVGGSGLYLRALIDGLSAQPPRDPELRSRLAGEAAEHGASGLHERLRRLDPERAAELDAADLQRVSRALEIIESSGHTTAWWREQPRAISFDAEWRVVELTTTDEEFRDRIATRTREMFDSGLIEETRALIGAGREAELSRLQAVGYDEAIDLVHGRSTREQAEARTSQRTRQLAKRQRTWFRHQLVATRIPVSGGDIEAMESAVWAALQP